MIDMETAADPREQQWKRMYDEASQEEEIPPPPAEPNLWQIGAGAFIMLAGVILPVMAITVATSFSFEGIWRLTLLHPIETAIEALLIALTPAANYKSWHALCHNDLRHPIRLGILNGVAIAVPLITLTVAVAACALGYPLIDSANGTSHFATMVLMGFISAPALAAAIFLTHCLRKAKHTRDARIRTILYSLMGIGLTLASFAGGEFRSAYIRLAQTYALSDDSKEREIGLSRLRDCAPEKELKMVCADQHAAGIAGMFLPLDANAQKRLYFAATGKPYRDRQSTNMSLMSNDYLRNHVVGPQIDGLSLHRSGIFGNVHPRTLSSTLRWEFVFKNRSYMNQEARAEIALPEGAVISDLTIWINGQPRSGSFSANENANAGSTTLINIQHQDPALITDLGRGRYLLQASPVPGQGEMKVSVSITEPIKLDGSNNASFGIPRFIDSNFALNGHHGITLRSTDKLISGLPSVKSTTTADGAQILTGELKEEDISNSAFSVKLDHPVQFKAIGVKDVFDKNNPIFEQLLTREGNAPKHLVVVVDSSQSMENRIADVVKALNNIPGQIETTIMLAGDKETGEVLNREEGIKRLKGNHFGGGQDNLFALVKAAERAGQSKGGAVLWIHGPQPGYNNEMYLMAPYAAAPKFFELALDDCLTDANEFFKNHKEVGPFTAISRSGPIGEDLQSFLSKWEPNATETFMDLSSQFNGQAQVQITSDPEAAREVSILNAAQEVQTLLAAGMPAEAAKIGVRYHIVTPVSGVVVLEQQAKQAQPASPPATVLMGTTSSTAQSQANLVPELQGATNGTLGPQGYDATIIQGINTAGTVRVNNLANMEALLNILANGAEILGLGLGFANVIMGAIGKSMLFPCKLSAKGRIVAGLVLAVIGLAVPGCINWLVASARDANLFD